METRVYRGPNYWSYDPAIKLVVDLGVLEQFPSNTIRGFVEGLLDLLPEVGQPLLRHRPTRRIRGAPARGDLAGPRGRARGAAAPARGRDGSWPGQDARHRRAGGYHVVYSFGEESVGLAAGRLAVRLVNHLVHPGA